MFNQIEVALLVFIFAAILVWASAHRLTILLDVLAKRTSLGEAFAGVVILGGATSLPELVTTITASTSNKPVLAGSNLLGGVAMQILVLTIIDFFIFRKKALTSITPTAALIMLSTLLIFILTVTILAISTGEMLSIYHIGFWPILLFIIYLIGLYLVYRYEGDPKWAPKDTKLHKQNDTIISETPLVKK